MGEVEAGSSAKSRFTLRQWVILWCLGLAIGLVIAGGVAWGPIAAFFIFCVEFGILIGIAKMADNGAVAKNDGRCPKCGGTSFKLKRSATGKVGLGLLAPKTMTRCQSCGAQFHL